MSKAELCEVYKSSREEGMYLYVLREAGLENVPQLLLEKFGMPSLVTTFALTPERKLARCTVDQVKEAIDTQGFFLQMPLRPDEYMTQVNRQNSKL